MTATPLYTSQRPHLIPAHMNWMYENGMSPNVLFLLDHPDVVFDPPPNPKYVTMQEFSEDRNDPVATKLPSIIINMSMSAIIEFRQTDIGYSFKCRMGGVPTDIVIPFVAILHIEDSVTKIGATFMSDLGWVTELIINLKKGNSSSVSEKVTGPDYGPLVVVDKIKPKSHLSVVK